jgi:hypothetical protein
MTPPRRPAPGVVLARAWAIAAVSLAGSLGLPGGPVPARAADASPWFAGASFGGGAGAARVEGARLEFGRSTFAFAISLRGGRDVRPAWRVGAQLDAVGAATGKVVPLGPGYPSAPGTTEHRVAINQLSLVGTWRGAGGGCFVRWGGGLSESFTEDWTAPGAAVRRTFGPGALAGVGFAPRLRQGGRIPVAIDGLLGRYGGRTGWAVQLTVGFDSH